MNVLCNWIEKCWQKRKDLLNGELMDRFWSLPLHEHSTSLLLSYFPN